MNIRKKIAEIILLTLTVVMGGGFVYYTMLSDIQMDSKSVSNIYIQKTESPTVQLDNINSKNSRHTSPNTRQKVISMPRAAATPLHRDIRRDATVTASGNNQPGNTNYTYSIKSRKSSDNYQGNDYGTTGILSYRSRGSQTNGEIAEQSTEGITLTEPGATSPFAVPKNPNGTPPSNGEDIILVDPMTDPNTNNKIPAGEGMGLLFLLITGYASILRFRKQN